MFKDGTYFEGIGFGATGTVKGEITFTSIPGSGYTEVLTDPTFKDQIVLFTYPSIGNFGVPAKEKDENGILTKFESNSIQLAGMIVNEYCRNPSHYQSVRTLEDWLIEENIPAIQYIDTRMITQTLVEEGSKLGMIRVYAQGEKPDIERLKQEVKSIEDPSKDNLVEKVSCKTVKTFTPSYLKGRVVVVDLGLKNNILRVLLEKGMEVIIVPFDHPMSKIMEHKPDGILLTNGPGNPELYRESIDLTKKLIEENIPILGIGLGHNIIGLGAGGEIYKMTAEHRGGRTTVETATNHCYITYQNHGYCLKEGNIGDFKPLYHDKDDNSNEGLIHKSEPIFSVAFNPEAAPGALDMKDTIFNKFIEFMEVK